MTDQSAPASRVTPPGKPLKVFGVRVRRQPGWLTIVTRPRLVVAAASRAAAVRAIAEHHPGFTDTYMARHGDLATHPADIAAATSAPGTVFVETDYESSLPVGRKFIPLGSTE